MRVPKRFPNRLAWDCYVLECAIQDRTAYAEAFESCRDEEGQAVRREAEDEIRVMRHQLAMKRRPQPTTNHDSKETPAVRCVDCANWTGCPNLAARNKRKGCEAFERGGEPDHDAQDAGEGG